MSVGPWDEARTLCRADIGREAVVNRTEGRV